METLTWLMASLQAKGTKSTLFLMPKEQSGLSTLGLRRWVDGCRRVKTMLRKKLLFSLVFVQ